MDIRQAYYGDFRKHVRKLIFDVDLPEIVDDVPNGFPTGFSTIVQRWPRYRPPPFSEQVVGLFHLGRVHRIGDFAHQEPAPKNDRRTAGWIQKRGFPYGEVLENADLKMSIV